MDKNNKKPKRFRLINLEKEGKGISKNRAELAPGFKKFFLSYFANFNKLVSVNIFMVLGNFPLIFLIINLSGYFKTPYFLPFSDLFQNLSGLMYADGDVTPYEMSVYAIEGLQHQQLANTALNYVFYGLGALSLLTFGLVNVGTAYIIRNMVMGEPVFTWHDFWYAVKRNYKQALPFGAIDGAIIAVLSWNLYSLISSTSDFLGSMMFWSNVVLFILYFFMRYYMYVQMVTFKLSVFKMLKNSLIFALLGFKRNILALLGIVLGIILELLLLFGTGGILVPFAVAAPLAVLFSMFAYMKVYAAYPKIKQYMIDPYLDEHPDERPEASSEEAIMKDDVTEKERIEEIKKRNGISYDI
ncbi:MAG: DUF624 domain-containing protein [Ruminococcaceae bacterium]|nr:DUF624 domain-containing protein [Oscillospiraceae bacterium]